MRIDSRCAFLCLHKTFWLDARGSFFVCRLTNAADSEISRGRVTAGLTQTTKTRKENRMNTDELSTGGGLPSAKSKKREGEKSPPDLPTVIEGVCGSGRKGQPSLAHRHHRRGGSSPLGDVLRPVRIAVWLPTTRLCEKRRARQICRAPCFVVVVVESKSPLD